MTKRAVPGSEIRATDMNVVEMSWKLSLRFIATGTLWFLAWTLSKAHNANRRTTQRLRKFERKYIDLMRKILMDSL